MHAGKLFWCQCKRCADPTELKTDCSAIVCPECTKGSVSSSKPLDQNADWRWVGMKWICAEVPCPFSPFCRCDKCSYKLSAESVANLLDKISDELESIDPHNIPGLEGFLRKYTRPNRIPWINTNKVPHSCRYQRSLRPNHYLFLSAKYSLCQIYGRTEGYLIHELSLEDIKRKEQYCRDFLALIDVLEPGLTRLRGKWSSKTTPNR